MRPRLPFRTERTNSTTCPAVLIFSVQLAASFIRLALSIPAHVLDGSVQIHFDAVDVGEVMYDDDDDGDVVVAAAVAAAAAVVVVVGLVIDPAADTVDPVPMPAPLDVLLLLLLLLLEMGATLVKNERPK